MSIRTYGLVFGGDRRKFGAMLFLEMCAFSIRIYVVYCCSLGQYLGLSFKAGTLEYS